MGVDIKMVTGDHTSIAKEIAKKVGLGTHIITAEAIQNVPDAAAEKVVEQTDGFAQVFPEHKYRIVELLQSKDHIVGMTGDGVNDAPALKKADVGVAVAGATDAAKSAADIVLTRPGLSVIIDAFKESRKIFQRMNNYSIYRIAETIRVLFFVSITILAFNFFPITALMIVLLAILNDIPIMTIAYDNVLYSNKPERWNMREIITMATIIGWVGVLATFLILYIALFTFNLDIVLIQSFIFLKLTVAGHLTIFVSRTKGRFWTVLSRQLSAVVDHNHQSYRHPDSRLWSGDGPLGLGPGHIHLDLCFDRGAHSDGLGEGPSVQSDQSPRNIPQAIRSARGDTDQAS